MAAVRIRPPRDAKCRAYREHLRDRVDKRQFLAAMAMELDEWLKSAPQAPDLDEAPEGWHKFFDSFTICGEGECIKTLFTIYAPGKPRRNSINWTNGRSASSLGSYGREDGLQGRLYCTRKWVGVLRLHSG